MIENDSVAAPASPTSFRSFSEQSKHYFDRAHTLEPSDLIRGPAAWVGKELRAEFEQNDPSWCYTLTDQDCDELHAAVAAAPADITQINQQNFSLPDLSKRIAQWRSQLQNGRGVQIVKGFPTQESRQWTQCAYWGLGHHLGEPGAQNPQQELLGEVKDYREQDANVRLYRTPHDINLHCDGADVVGLLCLQNAAHGGHSRLVSTVTLFNRNHMQVSANSQLQMQAYNKTQQLKPAMEQTASPKTLQSDTVSISQEAMAAASGADLHRGGTILSGGTGVRPK